MDANIVTVIVIVHVIVLGVKVPLGPRPFARKPFIACEEGIQIRDSVALW